ncbi:MocR-like pyridoxine biosynthesis transcription factor PdxR [Streptoalloteichus hindustanus]|uniref:GntR family transcriptional regulator / MocR family aminotransferase n=1 Tax=Streptoalloteichus hindustanus TaxID=2017 RepID=A0A1M5GST2_STRHI|nr:PLP-dependent aminotransferase family protein [Streptoalloteichus hindustanus]SHG06562.1 GntR family transcriptional regulator / MocR family aminotransferase [Streptoalloteichus hindustanus]
MSVPSQPLPAELPIALDRARDVPLAVQLADALRAAAAAGQLRRGDRLPSTRTLATHLGVSRTVTAAAYEQLHAEGWIDGRHGSGTFVTTTPPGARLRPRAVPRQEPAPDDVVHLVPGAAWAEGLDRAAWRRAWRAAADEPPMILPRRAGLPSFRAAVAEHLLRHRGLVVPAESERCDPVLATAGTTAAVAELAQTVLRRGDRVAVEEPGYQRAVGVFRAAGMEVVGVPVDSDGLVVAAIPDDVRAVFCSPAHQYPVGGRMPAARRVELVGRARARGWLVIEDDYDGELRYDVAPLPLLAALAPDVVVHLGTTSKIISPVLGTGWMVAPPAVAGAVLEHRDRTGTSPAAAGQRVVVAMARHGDLGRHLRRLRRELAARRAFVVDALTSAGLPVLGDDAGAHVLVPVRSAEAERRVVAEGERRGLRLDVLSRHYNGVPDRHGIPVGYTAPTRARLRAAVPVLVDLLRSAQ